MSETKCQLKQELDSKDQLKSELDLLKLAKDKEDCKNDKAAQTAKTSTEDVSKLSPSCLVSFGTSTLCERFPGVVILCFWGCSEARPSRASMLCLDSG